MFFIFLSFFISSIFFFSIGAISCKVLFSQNLNTSKNYYEFALIGIISASIIAFLINFFSSLNRYVNDILFFFPILIILFNKKIRLELNLTKITSISLLVSVFSTILISYDNVYRPDAGLYHLPYISILNENKIIIGLSNIHFRFGHASIIQYVSALLNNHVLLDNGILIPSALIFCYVTLFLVEYLKKEKNKINILIFFLFLIFIFFRINRYSSFGNDAPTHFYFLYLIVLALDYKKNRDNLNHFFNKISLVSIFIFFNKITMFLCLFVPLYYFLNKNFLNLLKNKIFIFIIFIFFFWMGKNVLVSGCLSFPVEQTCIASLEWFDKSETRRSNAISGRIENEAWTKGAPHQQEKSFSEFISTYEWIDIWKDHAGKKIIKKITPFSIFVLLTILYLLIFEKKKKIELINIRNRIIWFLIILNLIGSLLWFIKFPVLRYGYGYLIGFFSISLSVILSSFIEINLKKFKKKLKIVFFVFFIGLTIKHSLRIYENLNVKNSPWPNIYSDAKENKKFENIPIIKDNVIIFYAPNPKLALCYYSKLNPCTHLVNSEFNYNDVKFQTIYGYKKFSFKE